jgi:hypothetical protein
MISKVLSALVLVICFESYAEESINCEKINFKSDSSEFITSLNFLNIIVTENTLKNFNKTNNKKLNLKLAFYSGLRSFVKKKYNLDSFNLEVTEVVSKSIGCENTKAYILEVPLKNLIVKKTNTKYGQASIDEENIDKLDYLNFDEFK